MDKHALSLLARPEVWKFPNVKRTQESGKQSRKFEAVTSKLLYYLISESQKFGGEVLTEFWNQLGECDGNLKENIESLKGQPYQSIETTYQVLFDGVETIIDYSPVRKLAAEFFTHLGVAFMNPGGKKPGGDTEFSVSDAIDEETEKLLEVVEQRGKFGKRKQVSLKALSFKRDGERCLLTSTQFMPFDEFGIPPILAHIIPNAVHGKPDTLKCIAMFASVAAANDVAQHLYTIGNVMNLEQNVHTAYDNLMWGVEAKEEGGEVKYFFRLIPSRLNQSGPGFIKLKEGDEICFGRGVEGKQLGTGPILRLCNLQLAVARVLKMSGAADIILEWKDEADDDGLSRLFISCEEFCDILNAKLLLSGRAVVAEG